MSRWQVERGAYSVKISVPARNAGFAAGFEPADRGEIQRTIAYLDAGAVVRAAGHQRRFATDGCPGKSPWRRHAEPPVCVHLTANVVHGREAATFEVHPQTAVQLQAVVETGVLAARPFLDGQRFTGL